MTIEKRLPEFLWGEAVLHASWIRNRSPTTVLDGKTPFEALSGNRQNLSVMRQFGEEVYVFEELPGSKIEPKARKCIFTGFEDGPKAIRFYDTITRRIKVSRNYTFIPDVVPESTENPPKNPINSSQSQTKVPEDRNVNSSDKIEIRPNHVKEEIHPECKEFFNSNGNIGKDEDNSRKLRQKTASGKPTKETTLT